jgi:hypothetical protein
MELNTQTLLVILVGIVGLAILWEVLSKFKTFIGNTANLFKSTATTMVAIVKKSLIVLVIAIASYGAYYVYTSYSVSEAVLTGISDDISINKLVIPPTE